MTMKVYTRQGDKGQTSLFNGTRVSKDHALVDAYGTVDECNSTIGLATAYLSQPAPADQQPDSEPADAATQHDRETLLHRLQTVQHYLFDLGAHLATPRSTSAASKIAKTGFAPDAAATLEAWIDDMEPKLPALTTFVLPGGHPAAAALHLARTVARRAERAVTPLFSADAEEIDEAAYRFLNRLSDFLFVASRLTNRIMRCPDVMWSKLSANGAANGSS